MLDWLWILMMMMMLMKTEAVSIETISVISGEGVLLYTEAVGQFWDVRWTQEPHLLLTRNGTSAACHGRCQLLANGSLCFSQVQSRDSGIYMLEVFDEQGKVKMTKNFLLQVEVKSMTQRTRGATTDGLRIVSGPETSPSSVICPVLTDEDLCVSSDFSSSVGRFKHISFIVLLLPLIIIIIIIVLRKKTRIKMKTTSDQKENVYVVMHGTHGNKKKDEEEESAYVPCSPLVSMETTEDIYV
ncbi:uncharacterized protein KZ484_018814 isoform 1-T2 [Pholidichthys leucotaenia]